jgi:REP element-mobilizing transposase RayT
MPRKPRMELEPGVHHVFARGVERRKVFEDDRDRRMYVALLARAVRQQRWRLLAFCLMPNHIHLLVETVEPMTLGLGMQGLHGDYAQAFNQRHARAGHLWGGRYGSKRMEDDGQLWLVAAYIAANPVAARLCRRPEAWRWSSHASVSAPAANVPPWLDVERLLSYFSVLGGDPRERYATLVADRLEIG